MSGLTRRDLAWLACGLAASLARPLRAGDDALDLAVTRRLLAAAREAWRTGGLRAAPDAAPVALHGFACCDRLALGPHAVWLRRQRDLWSLTLALPPGVLTLAGRGERLARITGHPSAPSPDARYDTILLDGGRATLACSAALAQRLRPAVRVDARRIPGDYERFARTLLTAGRAT